MTRHTISHREHDLLVEAQEQELRDRERAARSALVGVPIPRPPQGAIPRDPYPEPEPLLDEPELPHPAAGTPELQDAWAEHQHEQELLRRAAEADAVSQLDRLRLEALERDKIEIPKLGGEPVRTSPRDRFYWQGRYGRP